MPVRRTVSGMMALLLLASGGTALAVSPKIAWYGRLADGLAEAKRTNRPILLVSAAPQCQNVAGMW